MHDVGNGATSGEEDGSSSSTSGGGGSGPELVTLSVGKDGDRLRIGVYQVGGGCVQDGSSVAGNLPVVLDSVDDGPTNVSRCR